MILDRFEGNIVVLEKEGEFLHIDNKHDPIFF
ncbi:hypothetical protein SAMN05446037_1008136 [Anaerovirgula multivorans]|uniref:Uncharacterized protein n=1 Tax=Anaerovirgula multivorans TaxID=312168 RepID=A0A239DT57_9FIRM|nr:hypothetical protein SAMN05446037_1008136 [Anaerovirgula multivorans]